MKTLTRKRNIEEGIFPANHEFNYAVVNYYPNSQAAIWYQCDLLESAEWYLDELEKDTRYDLLRKYSPLDMADMQVVKLEWI